MKKMGKGLISMVAVLLISTGFPVTQNQASAEPIAEPSNYHNIRDFRTFKTVGNGYTTSGGFVGAVQANLWSSGYRSTVGTVDQSFGPATRSGVLSFQRRYGLSADGLVGPGTWGKMDQLTSTIRNGMRTYRGSTNATYKVDYVAGNSFGGSNEYILRNNSTNAYITHGTMWKTTAYPYPQQLLKEDPNPATTPTKEDLEELDIPIHLNYSSKATTTTQADPELSVYEKDGVKSVTSWVHTDSNPILVAETTYDSKIDVDEMVKDATTWNEHYDVEITDFKGHPMVVTDKGDGFFEIHIVTPEKLFALGSTEKDILLSIAEEIDFK